jgi:hypothetical protein
LFSIAAADSAFEDADNSEYFHASISSKISYEWLKLIVIYKNTSTVAINAGACFLRYLSVYSK